MLTIKRSRAQVANGPAVPKILAAATTSGAITNAELASADSASYADIRSLPSRSSASKARACAVIGGSVAPARPARIMVQFNPGRIPTARWRHAVPSPRHTSRAPWPILSDMLIQKGCDTAPAKVQQVSENDASARESLCVTASKMANGPMAVETR